MRTLRTALIAALACLVFSPIQAEVTQLPDDQLEGLMWREVGPYRGGRSAAVAGIPQDRQTYYFGGTGGGVWKSRDAGLTWDNVSDGFFGGSIGAVAVSAWDPNVIYVGTGEKTVRGNVSHGNGMWKSTDAGRTWSQIGLEDSRHIPRVQIHPRNPELVYAAALGHLFGPNEQRGVFRSRDGGESWEKVLYVNDEVGAVDLVMDPTNPRILYASTWRILRTPYSLESGGAGSALWKSTDGGDTWENLMDSEGLPEGPIGIIGVSVSASNPDNVYAIIEAEEGGVFRSRDAGKTWARVNKERKLRQRAWYYTRINADPGNEDTVYVLNVRFHRSRDGGKTFEQVPTPHGDNHDLWIDPADPARMVQANDGGANVSFDGGLNWTTQSNQPTSQMYRVSVDNAFPYRLLGGQQDNSAVRIRSESAFGSAISVRDWEPTAGGESGHIVAKPDDPDIVYGGSYGGYLIRMDHRTGNRRAVNVWPDNPMGWGAAELRYRFNWNFPLQFSPHDPNRLYAAANVLFVTEDEGQTWRALSPDLTRNIKERQGPSGGPITKDNTSVEYYGTIFAMAESLVEPGVLWTGSDDGMVHVSRDGGENWQDVTPSGLPREIQINSIEPHPMLAGGLYLAATGYKSDDFRPYLYRTEDYGRRWKKITDGIARDHFTRVIRADAEREGLLFAGTESGLYASFNNGDDWLAFQRNLPVSPITDLAIKDGDLIAATQGRGYWILDDISLLRNLDDEVLEKSAHLFPPRDGWRLQNGSRNEPLHMGQNPPSGVVFHYLLGQVPEADVALTLDIETAEGELIRRFTRKPENDEQKKKNKPKNKYNDDRVLEAKSGLNQFVWDLRYPGAETFEKMVLWNRQLSGPRATPGMYRASLSVGDAKQTVDFTVRADPRSPATADDYRNQFEFARDLRDKITQIHGSIREIRAVRSQIKAINKRVGDAPGFAELKEAGDALSEELTTVEKALYETRMESRQDPLNFPIKLNDKLAGVMSLANLGDNPPTAAMTQVRDALWAEVSVQLERLAALLDEDLGRYNELASESGLVAVSPDSDP
ncbi:MAG: glycosyl hydrolase [Pseudomonadota bacterium]